jgi:hypothetical protein
MSLTIADSTAFIKTAQITILIFYVLLLFVAA